MSKKKPARGSKPKSDQNTDAITDEKLLGYFTAAYVLDAVGLLEPTKKKRLDSLAFPNCPRWDECVEGTFRISRTFVRSVYGLCTEHRSPPEAVSFILRGLGCPEYQQRLEEVLGL